MVDHTFDFQRFVAERKGARAAELREGAAYAYSRELRILRLLDRLKPVRQAIDGAVKLWHGSARAELLGPAVRADHRQFARFTAAAERAAERLHVALPAVYVTPAPLAGGWVVHTFGTELDAAVLMHASLAERLSDDELGFALGREVGHLQNGHVPLVTALYFLEHMQRAFVRWIVSPATRALAAWQVRAELTADRAGLIVCRDLDLARTALPKIARSGEPEAQAAVRREALGLFADSAYFRGILGQPGGLSGVECDAQVSKRLP